MPEVTLAPPDPLLSGEAVMPEKRSMLYAFTEVWKEHGITQPNLRLLIENQVITGDFGNTWQGLSQTVFSPNLGKKELIAMAQGMQMSGMKPLLVISGENDLGIFLEMLQEGNKFSVIIQYDFSNPTKNIYDQVKSFIPPSTSLFFPADAVQTKRLLPHFFESENAILLLSSEASPVVTNDFAPFEPTEPSILKSGSDISLITCGQNGYIALEAARILDAMDISAQVIHLHTISVPDSMVFMESIENTDVVMVVEEGHRSLGKEVAVWLGQYFPRPLSCIDLNDIPRNSESAEVSELVIKRDMLVEQAKILMARKNEK